MHRILRVAPATLMGLSMVLAAACVDQRGLSDPDGGSETGSAGTGMGTAGATGAGTAGTKGPGTGVAGASGPGTAGSTGNTGASGANGKAGTGGGQAGTGGLMCGPVCAIYCEYGNVPDANGCPTCKCNPGPTACKIEECGPQPASSGAADAGAALPAPCGGKLAPPRCERNAVGRCAWTPTTCECGASACLIYCPYGNKVDPNTGCQLCACNPPPAACTKDDCGSLPPADYSVKCEDGKVLYPTCDRQSAGMCGWTFPKCPPPVCPAIDCLNACPNGNRVDAKGCQTCQCNEPVACSTLGDWKSCTADARCQWLQPGCGTPALSTPGCFAREDVGCQGTCSNGRTCLKRVIDPCYNPGGGASCDACGLTQTVCL
jgi:hypothetical protein